MDKDYINELLNEILDNLVDNENISTELLNKLNDIRLELIK